MMKTSKIRLLISAARPSHLFFIYLFFIIFFAYINYVESNYNSVYSDNGFQYFKSASITITGNLKAFVDKQELSVPIQNLWRDLNLEGHSLHFTFFSYGRFCFSLILTLCSCACIKSPECWGMLSSNANKAEMYDVKKNACSGFWTR